MPDVSDVSDLAKIAVRADPGGRLAGALGVPYGRAAQDADGTLVVGTAPDGWLVLAPAGTAASVVRRWQRRVDGEFATVVDLTHGYTAVRLTGAGTESVLAGLCALDLTDAPDHTANRCLFGGITATVIRDDGDNSDSDNSDGGRSYLLLCERSYGQYLVDVLTDAGATQPARAPT